MYQTIFSPCRTYRYTLWRMWNEHLPFCQFIGLNPSTADEVNDDPTVRRCIRYAQSWGYGSLCMTNIFAFRATDPNVMRAAVEPVGAENDFWLQKVAENAGIVVAAWGTHGAFQGRGDKVKKLLPNLHCLKITKEGHPQHPLYLRKDLQPLPFSGE